MRVHAHLLVLGLAACGSSSNSNPQTDSGPPLDATPDAPPDAPPLAGKACSTYPFEVARISGVNLSPSLGGLFARDADNDGKPDILVFEYVSSTTTDYTYRIRLFRQGATGFLTPTSSNIVIPRFGPERVTVGDFNGDQLLDVAYIYSTSSPNRAPFVYVATQQADHTFVAGARLDVSACKSSTDERTFGLAVIDLDRDGKDDLLTTVSYQGLGAAPEGLTLLKGTATGLGSGTCIASATVATPGIPSIYFAEQIFVGDLDGDGDKDLVANSFDNAHLYYATAAATFAEAPGTAAVPFTGFMQVNVLKTRMKQDLVHGVVNAANSEVRRYVLDPVTGISTSVVATLPEKDDTRAVLAGDFNGDGLSDALVIGRQAIVTATTFAMTCDRTLTWDIATNTFPGSVDAAIAIDFDGDGRTEVLTLTSGDVVVYRMQ